MQDHPTNTVPSVEEDLEELVCERKASLDVIGNYIRKAQTSKTRRLLNLFYSLIFGFISTHYMSPKFRHRKVVGFVLAIVAYLTSMRLSSKKIGFTEY